MPRLAKKTYRDAISWIAKTQRVAKLTEEKIAKLPVCELTAEIFQKPVKGVAWDVYARCSDMILNEEL